MRNSAIVVSLLVLFITAGVASIHNPQPKPFSYDPQVAAGEWKIEVQEDLPCAVDKDGKPYMQVILPVHRGEPVSIECTEMPVGIR
jgi:hypothetical protein